MPVTFLTSIPAVGPRSGSGPHPAGRLAALIVSLVATACISEPAAVDVAEVSGAVETIDGWGDGALDIYFIPGGEAAEDRLAHEIGAARSSVRVAMYNVTSARLGYALLDAQRRGVAVEVLWDGKQMVKDHNTLDDDLVAAGLTITPVTNRRSEYATVHDKLSVIDGELVTMGSANWGTSALHDNDESLLVFRSPTMAAVVAAQLDEIRSQVKRPRIGDLPGPAQLYFSPEDRLDRVVTSAIDGAQSRIFVAVFSLRLRSASDALVRAHNRGVQVFVVTDRKQSIESVEDERLRAAGISVIEAHNTTGPYTAMHHKFAVIDDRVLVGAYNWTTTATFSNDEDLVVIRDAEVAAAYAGEMGRLWRRYGGDGALPLPALELSIGATCDRTAWGDELVLVGDAPELGAWDPARGVRLDGATWPRWTGRVTVPAGARLRYKLALVRADGRVDWEVGADREVVLPTDPQVTSAEIDDAFRY